MMSQLTFSMITLLVLFSTLCPAGDRVEVHQVKFSCPLSGRWNAVCIQQPPSLNVVLPTRWVDAAHSLESAVQVVISVNLAFMDPMAVLSHLAIGSTILLLLGSICWVILMTVWLTCSAAVARINPLYTVNCQNMKSATKQCKRCDVRHKQNHEGELIARHC